MLLTVHFGYEASLSPSVGIRNGFLMCIAALFLFSPTGARAHHDNWMFAWASQPSAASYTPSQYWSHNALGGVIRIDRAGPGRYEVYFSGADLDRFSDESEGRQATGYGPDGHYCDVDQAMVPITVHCFDATGIATDTRFSLILTAKHDHGRPHPYVTVAAMQPSTPSYVPVDWLSGVELVTRTGEGRYSVLFDDFWAGGDGPRNAQVTVERTNTAGTGHHCNILSWSDLVVNVQCFNASGAAADTAFYAHLQRETLDLPTVAFAWANHSTNPSYAPDPDYVSNPGGGAVMATRTATGRYSIRFDGFSAVGEPGGGQPQVSTYGEDDRRCSVRGWSPDTVDISCFDAAGAPADTRYSVIFRKRFTSLVTRNMALAKITNVWASSTVDPQKSWNPRGVGTESGPVEFTRLGVGQFRVTFTGFGALGEDGGTVMVTALDGAGHCSTSSWSGDSVNVRCFDLDGVAADRIFSVAYLKPDADNEAFGYVWNPSASASTPSPGADYTHNPSGSAVSISRTSAGFYRVTFTGISAYGHNQGVPIVTPYGTGTERCQIVYWTGDWVDVKCFAPSGAAADSRFVLVWFKPRQGTDGLLAALADLPTEPIYQTLPSKTHHPMPQEVGYIFRDGPGDYHVGWDDLRDVGFEEYLFASSAGTAAVACRGSAGISRSYVYCRNPTGVYTDTQFTSVLLVPTRLPEPGVSAQLAAGLVLLTGLARRRARSSEAGD